MARMTVVHKQNTSFSRLLDLKIETLKRSLSHSLLETSRAQSQLQASLLNDRITCEKCKHLSGKSVGRDKMDHRKHGHHGVYDFGHSNDLDKYDKHRVHAEREADSGRSPVTDHTFPAGHSDHREFHGGFRKSGHHGHLEKSASFESKHAIVSHTTSGSGPNTPKLHRSPELRRQNSASATDAGDSSPTNTNLTAFLFSRHCRHGYVMKTASDPTKESNEHIKNKIRAKVVKNYLLQDVFKRLNTTKTIDFRNKVHERGSESKDTYSSETMHTLEKCRYLRVPKKKSGQTIGDHDSEDDKLPKVDVL